MNYDEEEYGYSEEILEEHNELVQETDLPAIVRNWEKVALSYSRHNNIPAIIGFYTLLGDMVKNMVEIPFGETTNDTRIHFCWIQTARTGKTTLLSYVLGPVAKEIYTELADEEYVDSKVVNFADYTTAALIGNHTENKKFNEDAEELFQQEIEAIENNDILDIDEITLRTNKAIKKRDSTKNRYDTHLGPIHGEGIWIADEFEGSGVFKEKTHKENMNIVFQNLMNNFHSGSNLYEKILTGKPTIELDSRFSIIASTFPPEHLLKTVAQKGILQRFLPYVWDVPDDIITAMRKQVISGFGTISENQGPPLELKKGMINLFKLTKKRFESVGKNRLSTIEYDDSVKNSLDLEHSNLLDYIDDVNPRIRRIIRLFEQNLVEYIAKLAVLNCIAMSRGIADEKKRFIVLPQNVRQGAYIVRKCYMALVDWLENAVKVDRRTMITKSNWKEFQKAYTVSLEKAKPTETLDGGYVWKNLVLTEAGRILQQAYVWTYKKYNDLSEMFESKKKGRQVYIRPKMEEEK